MNIPTTYAGGANSKTYSSTDNETRSNKLIDISDLDLVDQLSQGKVDLTYGRYDNVLPFISHLLIFPWQFFGYFWRYTCELQ